MGRQSMRQATVGGKMGALDSIDDEASGRESSTELRRCPLMGFGVNALVLMLEDAGSSQDAARRTMDQQTGCQRTVVFKCILIDLMANFKIISLLVSCSLAFIRWMSGGGNDLSQRRRGAKEDAENFSCYLASGRFGSFVQSRLYCRKCAPSRPAMPRGSGANLILFVGKI